MRSLRIVMLLALVACGSGAPRPTAPGPQLVNPAPPPPPPPSPQALDLDSTEILARTAVESPVMVKHVLIGWADLAAAYHDHLDPRAAKRTQAEAAKLAQEVEAKLRDKPDSIDALIDAHSEDPGSLSKEPYVIATDDPFISEFKNLAQRLRLGEVGLVKTSFGYHVVVRVPPPPLDPLESADILARPGASGPVDVQHIVIGWKDLAAAKDPRAKTRTKAEADTLATATLEKARKGANMVELMKQVSEDPGSADSGKPYTIDADSGIVEPFKKLALRLTMGEVGMVKTLFGWHVIKRVPPAPPDKLESTAILKRTEINDKVRVLHILLGWKEVHASDPRGEKRTRAELEKLVKATLARLAKKGTKFEALMAELSEDPGSAKTGEAYEVTPDAPMVKPFIALSVRLALDEIGVVKTEFGIHIIKRVE